MAEQLEQYRERALVALARPFWGKPRIGSLLVALVGRLQDLEDDAWAVMLARTLDEADMPRLVVLGKIIGQPRHGFELEDYRRLIRARARANVSRGTARDVLDVLDILVGVGQYTLTEVGNATLLITASILLTTDDLRMIREVAPDARAAGVAFQLLSSDDADVFRWGDQWGPPKIWGSVIVL